MFNKRLGYEISKATMQDSLHQAEQERLAQIVSRQPNGVVKALRSRLSFKRQAGNPVSQRALRRRTAIILVVLALLSLLTVSMTHLQESVPFSEPKGDIGDQAVTDGLSEDEMPCLPTVARLLCPSTG